MKESLVYGVGINDADYTVQINEFVGFDAIGKKLYKLAWMCPFYSVWHNMITRCYSSSYQKRQPSYVGCKVDTRWLRFSTFKSWMITQPWEGNGLDKDILFPGNRVYSPDACVFVTQRVNSFLAERGNDRGEYPIGVGLHKQSGLFRARCGDTEGGRQNLGYFQTPEEAHQAWLSYKLEQARILASKQTDIRVAEALVKRYEEYK